MIIKKPTDIKPSEITDKDVFFNRRKFMQAAGTIAVAGMLDPLIGKTAEAASEGQKLPNVIKNHQYDKYEGDRKVTSYKDATTYNNFYEFGVDKRSPSKLAGTLHTRPWKVTIDGEVEKPGEYDIDNLLKPYQLEERIYRFRCVEGWSMVVPWVGFSLADLLKQFKPTSRAKYVEFTTLFDPKQMPGQRRAVLQWPYREGLRIDEAMHPLAMLVVGCYGEVLPNQNGAPLRLIVPWKYGFKNIKSIVRIRLTETQPETSWNIAAANEYGFYANVNPAVDHPRWSQKYERVLGSSFFAPKKPTLVFNGYADEVAGLYKGMDLRKYF